MYRKSLSEEIADKLEQIVLFSWLSIFLFYLIVPTVMLFVYEFQLAAMIKNAKNRKLSEIGEQYQLSLILSKIPLIGLAGWIMKIMLFDELAEWGQDQQVFAINSGAKTLKLGKILEVIGIGVFFLPGGFKKLGQGFRALPIEDQSASQFGSGSQTDPTMVSKSPAQWQQEWDEIQLRYEIGELGEAKYQTLKTHYSPHLPSASADVTTTFPPQQNWEEIQLRYEIGEISEQEYQTFKEQYGY